MKRNRAIVILLLATPPALLLLWHLCNHGLPADDAANYAETALQISKEFQHGTIAGLHTAVFSRGWRPTVLAVLALPFIGLTNGDVVGACAATLFVFYVSLTSYLYRLGILLTD